MDGITGGPFQLLAMAEKEVSNLIPILLFAAIALYIGSVVVVGILSRLFPRRKRF